MAMAGVDETASIDPTANEQLLINRLRIGDEAAFVALVGTYQSGLLRLARHYVRAPEAAEDVVQETWMGVLRGIDRFEGRSSLKTWIFRILINRARTRGASDARSVAFSQLGDDEPAVEAERFRKAGPLAGHWSTRPESWEILPESWILGQETLAMVRSAIDRLPANQREVITLRDIEGWSAAEVCNILEITETNQRVLLHRARSKVRQALEQFIGEKR